MIVAILVLLGLCLGSFVNALVWRLHEQAKPLKGKKATKKPAAQLSIARGRSMCPNCRHELAAKDLVPVLSWLSLRGECRYCHKPIPVQYPLVELATAGLFVASYFWWPAAFSSGQVALFVLWIGLLTGLMALLVYDARWMLLPNRIIYPLSVLALAQAIVNVAIHGDRLVAIGNYVLAVIIGGGIFYVLFQVSSGKWIGGGDVKLGWLLGLLVATPSKAALFIFIGALLGSIVSLPLMAANRLKRSSTIPFGPFLIVGAIVTVLFGHDLLHWYTHTLLSVN